MRERAFTELELARESITNDPARKNGYFEAMRVVRALPTQPKEAKDETKWRCLNCGYVDGRNVTFTEHCAICGEKVD